MIIFISNKGETLPVAWRLKKMGVPLEYYIHDPVSRRQYMRLMPRLRLQDLKEAVKDSERVVIDIILKNEKKDHDLELLDEFGISHDVPGLFGTLGDTIRTKYKKDVTGGGVIPEKYELDREEGIKLARKIGLSIPQYFEFKSLKDGAKFLYSGAGKGKEWVFKPNGNMDLDLTHVDGFPGDLLDLLTYTYPKRLGNDVEFILQEKITGEELSNELWHDGAQFLHPNRTLENKKLHCGDTGRAVGSQSNTVWPCKSMDGIVFRNMMKLLPLIKGLKLPVDANTIITRDGRAWFLEWTFRFGYSALFLFLELISGRLDKFFLKNFEASLKDGFIASQVLTLDPFPLVRDKVEYTAMVRDNLINNPINSDGMYWVDVYQDSRGKLRCAGTDGYLGVVTGHGPTAEKAIGACHDRLDEIKTNGISGDLMYRTREDHLASHLGRLKKLEAWGINIF